MLSNLELDLTLVLLQPLVEFVQHRRYSCSRNWHRSPPESYLLVLYDRPVPLHLCTKARLSCYITLYHRNNWMKSCQISELMTYVNILTLLCCHLPFHYGPHINSSIPSFVTLANNTDSQEINCVWKTKHHTMTWRFQLHQILCILK